MNLLKAALHLALLCLISTLLSASSLEAAHPPGAQVAQTLRNHLKAATEEFARGHGLELNGGSFTYWVAKGTAIAFATTRRFTGLNRNQLQESQVAGVVLIVSPHQAQFPAGFYRLRLRLKGSPRGAWGAGGRAELIDDAGNGVTSTELDADHHPYESGDSGLYIFEEGFRILFFSHEIEWSLQMDLSPFEDANPPKPDRKISGGPSRRVNEALESSGRRLIQHLRSRTSPGTLKEDTPTNFSVTPNGHCAVALNREPKPPEAGTPDSLPRLGWALLAAGPPHAVNSRLTGIFQIGLYPRKDATSGLPEESSYQLLDIATERRFTGPAVFFDGKSPPHRGVTCDPENGIEIQIGWGNGFWSIEPE